MKIFLFILIIIFYYSNSISAFESIYDSDYKKIDIDNEIISEAKFREIDKVKILSLNLILNNILTKNNLFKLSSLVDIKKEINYLIRNINIENEFISSNKYSANIKINFDKKQIIELLRENNISYTDIKSSNILLIFSEKNEFTNEGLSKNNNLYKEIKKNKKGLLNFIYPDLSLNDRYILPYKKIIEKDLDSVSFISNKYKVNFAIIFSLDKISSINKIDISYYSSSEKKIFQIGNFKYDKDISSQEELFNILDEWWKEQYLIESLKWEIMSCSIINSNIHELNYVNSTIASLSQTESINLRKINLGKNVYDISYFGKLSIFSLKLLKYNIILKQDLKNDCIISIKN